MTRKHKQVLLLLCIVFLVLCVIASIFYHPRNAQNFYGWGASDFENEDSTALLVNINVYSNTFNPDIQFFLMYSRIVILLAAVIMSIVICKNSIVDKDKQRFASIFYAGSSLFVFLLNFVNLANSSQGIHNFFRKVSFSYRLGLIEYPWVLCNCVALLPILITLVLLIYELKINAKNDNDLVEETVYINE